MAKVVKEDHHVVGSCESMDDRSEFHQYYDDVGSAESQFLALKMLCEAAVKLSEEENADMEVKGSGELEITPTNHVMSRDGKESAPHVSPADQDHGHLKLIIEEHAKPLKKRKLNILMSSHEDHQDQSDGSGNDQEAIGSDADQLPPIPSQTARRRGRRRTAIGVLPMQDPSRCSRYNGRGWRCSRLTTLGHALCEYHLEKARIRGNKSKNHVDVYEQNDNLEHDDLMEEGEVSPDKDDDEYKPSSSNMVTVKSSNLRPKSSRRNAK